MSKIKNIALSLGIVAGLGASLVPAIAFADDDLPSASEDLLVNLQVNTVISMTIRSYSGEDVTESECSSNSDSGTACTGDDQVTTTSIQPGAVDLTTMYSDIFVSTNSQNGYILKLADKDEDTSLKTADGYEISAINSKPAAVTDATPNPGWAVSIGDTDTWQAVPAGPAESDPTTAETPITVKNYTPANPSSITNDQSTVHYGVAATSNQPTGSYTDVVVYTATAK